MKKILTILIITIIGGCSILKKETKSNPEKINLDSIKSENNYLNKTILSLKSEITQLKEDITFPEVSSGMVQSSPPPQQNDRVIIKWKENTNIIKKTTKEIQIGNVIYKTPDTMVVLVPSKVIVRISKGKLDTNSVVNGLKGSVNIVPINVTSKMEVTLVDPTSDSDPSFSIKPIGQSEQTIMDEVFTEWEFSVTPLKSGDKELNLLVSIIDGEIKKQQTWSDVIKVKSNLSATTLTFWQKYWQWMMTTIIIPIVVYFWKKIKEGKNKV